MNSRPMYLQAAICMNGDINYTGINNLQNLMYSLILTAKL